MDGAYKLENIYQEETNLEEKILGKAVCDRKGRSCGTVVNVLEDERHQHLICVEWRSFFGRQKDTLVPIRFFKNLEDEPIKLELSRSEFKRGIWKVPDQFDNPDQDGYKPDDIRFQHPFIM